ncbi:MAG: BON domain-containing protein [Rubrimonas sp.]
MSRPTFGRTHGAMALGAALLALAGASACTPVIPLAAGTGALTMSAMQERSFRGAFSDVETESTINGHLLNHSGEMFRRVGVDVVEGRVLLSGAVSTHDAKVKAAELAWRAPGTREVINELTVEGEPGLRTYAQDLWITTQLRTRLIGDQNVSSVNYNIETHRGVVHLIGLARSPEELERVTRTAARVPGVREVVSHVLYVNDPRRGATVSAAS